MTYYAHPHAVKRVEMTPRIAPSASFTDAADYRRKFPDGRIGSDPSQATPEKGAQIVAAAKHALVGELAEFFGVAPIADAAE